MTISVFLDGARKNKIADFYDKEYACALLKGVLMDAENLEKDTQLVFTARQGLVPKDIPFNADDLKNINTERGDL